jgi:(R,R)-butanediol dehydrogenase/meso-butanediol dehydrogenase/diacetyl reductase
MDVICVKKAILEDAYKFVIRDVPTPQPNPMFPFLIKVHCCSICGSDVHRYKFPPDATNLPSVAFVDKVLGYPSLLVLGHQFSGDIAEIAPNVKGWKTGDRVVGIGIQAYAEYALAKRVVNLPYEMSYEQGAFVEPVAVALSIVVRSGLKLGDTVVVLGAGPIGLFAMQCAKAMGAGKVYVTDILDARLKKAIDLGADDVINVRKEDPVDRIYELTNNAGPDVVFECAGKAETLNQMLEILPKRGKGVIAAIYDEPLKEININRLVMKNLDISGIFVSYDEPIFAPEQWLSRHDVFEVATELIRSGKVKVDPIITSILPLENINEAFMRLMRGEELGVIIKP